MNKENFDIVSVVDGVKSGNSGAFAELYRLTSKRAYYTALKITNNDFFAQDILQDVYSTVLEKINEIEIAEVFDQWFNKILAQKTAEFLLQNEPTLFGDEGEEVLGQVREADPDFAFDDTEEDESFRKKILKTIDNLSDDKRAVFLLFYFLKVSVFDISEAFSVPENAITSRINQAVRGVEKGVTNHERLTGTTFDGDVLSFAAWAVENNSLAVGESFEKSGNAEGIFSAIMASSVASSVLAEPKSIDYAETIAQNAPEEEVQEEAEVGIEEEDEDITDLVLDTDTESVSNLSLVKKIVLFAAIFILAAVAAVAVKVIPLKLAARETTTAPESTTTEFYDFGFSEETGETSSFTDYSETDITQPTDESGNIIVPDTTYMPTNQITVPTTDIPTFTTEVFETSKTTKKETTTKTTTTTKKADDTTTTAQDTEPSATTAEEQTYMVLYKPNGAKGTYPRQQNQTSYIVHTTMPTRKGYTFIGWKSSDDGAIYQPGDTITPRKTTTLTATWAEGTTTTKPTTASTTESTTVSNIVTVNVQVYEGTELVKTIPVQIKTGEKFDRIKAVNIAKENGFSGMCTDKAITAEAGKTYTFTVKCK